jgi:hypothetical protein
MKNTRWREDDQEHDHADDVLHRVVRVERDAVHRLAVGVLVLLDLDAVRVVRADLVQREMCATTRPSSTSGMAITCSAKKRFSVASDTT